MIEINFPDNSPAEWLQAARLELDGADPFEKLTRKRAGIALNPFYSDVSPAKKNLTGIPSAADSLLGARGWYNMPKVLVEDVQKSNKKALLHLNNGAEGILFELKNAEVDVATLLDSIELAHCRIHFLLNTDSHSFLDDFKRFAEKRFEGRSIMGSIFWKSENFSTINTHHTLYENWPLFSSAGIIANEHLEPIEQVADLLFRAVSLIDQSNRISIIQKIAFLVPIGPSFFLEVAKLKALRHLWTQVTNAYQVDLTHPLTIHAVSNPWINQSYEPHGNDLKLTTSALSAILGGCDALTCEPPDESSLNERLARNISSILREESHLNKVADPTAGSYFLDSVTYDLAQASWHRFQKLTSR